MPGEKERLASAREWLRHARSDVAIAKRPREPEVMVETLCFHAQQAAEKAIKAVLVAQGVRFPFTHDLARLLTMAQAAGIAVPDQVMKSAKLTEFAVAARYPGNSEEVSEEDYKVAVGAAEVVVAWAQAQLGLSPRDRA